MEGAIRKAILKPEESTNEVIAAIREVCIKLQNANTRFEMERDSDLIESSIYEIESLRARYRYLLRIAREQGIKGGFFPAVGSEAVRDK
ncbi:MAG: DUF2508 family protein [Oscillospiraceae bacterium]|nr:DUF2508 family protein [Oscillospiraceae bacterium]MDD3832766.1 DUF2508 family protein [Oscillospiraceae bacterium]